MLNQTKRLTAKPTRKKMGQGVEWVLVEEPNKKNLEKINLFYAEMPFAPQMQYKNWTPESPTSE